ncbi:DoxX family protein [Thioalkalivibrio sp. XN8]|uniref:DoxX family protein n=1 Tax=Thioalkalivibrio sp. XN8 TaxID=2712863 RepID=UPI0013ECB2C9|nr:DoxX family protein [Thioalkalivibrio sp. XN8]NGP54478.1 DoxX family protein [Thioalkalivibrio sp. XN8]
MALALRLATTLLVLVFFASGGAKLIGLQFEIEAFTRWGYPLWFMYLVGVIEVGGAVLLLVPRLTAPVAGGLAAFMLGAVATHVVHAEWGMLVVATTILLLAAWRAWAGLRIGRSLPELYSQV